MPTQTRQPARPQAPPAPVLVLGIGNILLRDEGVGVRVVEALAERSLPAGVEVFDGATAGLDLLDAIADRQRLIVVDALDSDDPPGTVRRLTAANLAAADGPVISLHDVSLVELLAVARRLGVAPREVIILGIRPALVGAGLELSQELQGRLPQIVDLVLTELGPSPSNLPQSTPRVAAGASPAVEDRACACGATACEAQAATTRAPRTADPVSSPQVQERDRP